MNSQVVQYQEHFALCIFDQRPEKLNELVRVERLINDHPGRLALIGHSRNHRQLVARADHRKRHRCFANRRVAPAPYICVDQCGLIASVNLCTFCLGFGFNGGVLLIEPGAHSFGALFVGFFDRLLQRKSSACQVVSCGPSSSSPSARRSASRLHLFVHADDLFAALMQYFSRLLAGIFFLHELLTLERLSELSKFHL